SHGQPWFPPRATPRGGASGGQISQIPGLSPTIKALPKERARGRRTRVLESDSAYIKLAKQGGHKGLLWYEDTVASKPDPYKPPDWYYTASEDTRNMSYPYNVPNALIHSEEKKNLGTFQPLEPPFGTDNISPWERDDSSSNGKEKNNDVHDRQTETFQSPSQYHQTSKFKKTAPDKIRAPVDMSKLLSFGYAEDDKSMADTDKSHFTFK
uniref:Uncharacterized protein n=1 Tax=Mola mola TaxID=94237 RepID=A0A3Q3VR19_MOLML